MAVCIGNHVEAFAIRIEFCDIDFPKESGRMKLFSFLDLA